MTLPCSTLTRVWAARFWRAGALFALLLSIGEAPALAQGISGQTHIASGRERDVILAAQDGVPTFGPRVAAVTLDLFLPFGHRATATELARYLSLLATGDDIRLRLHPVLGSEVAERGAELLLAAYQLAGPDSAPFLITVAEHPEWLTDWPSRRTGSDSFAQLGADRRRDGDLHLFAAASEHGLDVAQLRLQLASRRQQEPALSLWGRMRQAVRTPPEVWINGRRLRSPVTDSALGEELERQRRRAYQLLRGGTPLRSLYEELVASADSPERAPPPPPAWAGSRLLATRPTPQASPSLPVRSRSSSPPAGLDLTDVPLRGPRVSPVTLVLVGSVESGPTCELARELRETLQPYAESVRFAYLPAPNGALFSPPSSLSGSLVALGDRSGRVPMILAALALQNGAAFFRAYDAIVDLMRRRFLLSYVEFAQSILNQRVDFDRLEEQSRGERVRALVTRTQRDARALGASSLPALFLNGRLITLAGSPGSIPGFGGSAARREQLTRLIEAELRRGALEKLRSRQRPTREFTR
jgi:hypothetical protein